MKARPLAILAALALGGCGGEEIEMETGHRGAARRDPFLAAERFLEANDFDVSAHTWLEGALPNNGTLVAPALSLADLGTRDEVLGWVLNGGHLLLMLEGGEAFRNDWSLDSSSRETEPPEQAAVLNAFGVEKIERGGGVATVSLRGGSASAVIPARFTWKNGEPPEQAEIVAGDHGKIALASFRRGAGRITLAAHAEPFRNRHIGHGDNAWLLLQLIAQDRKGEVWFLNGVRASFSAMLWEHGWMALIAGGALLVVWLWKNLPRFGPLRTATDGSTRNFAEHLALTGAFLWRHDQHAPLVEPMREAVVRAAVRRGFARQDPELPEKLASFAQLPPLRVRVALLGENIRDPRHFLRAIQDLQRLHDKLGA